MSTDDWWFVAAYGAYVVTASAAVFGIGYGIKAIRGGSK